MLDPLLSSSPRTVPHGRTFFQGGAHPSHTRPPTRGSRLALCIWLPTFELRLELVRTPELDGTSVALLAPGEGTRREIWQISERAGEAGVLPGMPVSKAVGLCPSLTLIEPDPTHYDSAMNEMLEVLGTISPVIEPADRGCVFVGVDGLERLYGAPHRQIAQSLKRLFTVFPRPLVAATRAGWALGKFGAWVAAVSARPGAPVVVEEADLVRFLAGRPVAALPVEAVTIERLQRLDIATLGKLSTFPLAALISQFGKDGQNAHAWATGQRIDSVRPWHRPRPIRVSLDFPSPVGQTGPLYGALDRLLERALARPARRGRSIRGVRLSAHLENGGSWVIETILHQPTAERSRIAFTVRSRAELTPPPRAVEALTVEFFEFGAPSSQAELFDRKEENGRAASGHDLTDGDVPDALREAVRELKMKIGYSPLFRVVEVDPWSRIPERRHALLNFDP